MQSLTEGLLEAHRFLGMQHMQHYTVHPQTDSPFASHKGMNGLSCFNTTVLSFTFNEIVWHFSEPPISMRLHIIITPTSKNRCLITDIDLLTAWQALALSEQCTGSKDGLEALGTSLQSSPEQVKQRMRTVLKNTLWAEVQVSETALSRQGNSPDSERMKS